MKITITIETGNETMQTWEDVKSAIIWRLEAHPHFTGTVIPLSVGIKDVNGNKIGTLEVTEDETMTADEEAEEAGRRG